MTVRELREKYLQFFESKGHSRFPSGSLIPYDVTGRLDESLLFNGAGMVQFKPYFLGVAKPDNLCLITCQKVVRTGDIESVGNPSHLTFFEMLGNFSFGDYFKSRAIAYSWEFLTSKEWLGLDPKRLAFTVFEEDNEAEAEWERWLLSVEIDPKTRIFRLGEAKNYWPAGSFSSGPPGPCGPNSEMFYWVPNDEPPPTGPYSRDDYLRDDAAGKWLEIWNDVFIQFEWQGHLRNPERPSEGWEKDGMPPLPFQSVDTGMGLERTVVALSGLQSVYQTDAFLPIFRVLHEIASGGAKSSVTAGVPPAAALYAMSQGLIPDDETTVRAARIIADHIRTACFCIADGVLPGNTGRGYVLRRLIRRAVLKGQRQLGFDDLFLYKVFDGVQEALGDHYPELGERRDVIVETLKNEEALFRRTLHEGMDRIQFKLYVFLQQAVKQYDETGLTPSDPRLISLLNAGPNDPGSEAFWHSLAVQDEVINATGNAWSEMGSLLAAMRNDLGSAVISSKEGRALLRKLAQMVIDGDEAFQLYDTYGFPVEVTQELAEEAGLTVDLEGYEAAMAKAQARSRAAGRRDSVYGAFLQVDFEREHHTSVFTGYEECSTLARVIGVQTSNVRVADQAPARRIDPSTPAIVLDRTPFYVESGGQVSDAGVIKGDGWTANVISVLRQGSLIGHVVETPPELVHPEDFLGKQVLAQVDAKRRAAIQRNHTATHLLHAALRKTLGNHVTQAGSYVGPDRLRFDFTHGKAMTQNELMEVEKFVNEWSLENEPVTTYVDVPLEEAKAMGAMALFGEKYSGKVRVVQIGDMAPDQPSESRELCGGTHVRTTGEIGMFKIMSESSAASGVRRIEAITGSAALIWSLEQSKAVSQVAEMLKTNPSDIVSAVGKTLDQLKEEKRKREKAQAASINSSSKVASDGFIDIGPVTLWARDFGEIDPKVVASELDNAVASKPNLVAVAAVVADGRIQFLCKAGPDAVSAGANAGKLVGAISKIAGGGGGGRADFATAGGKEPGKLTEALSAAQAALEKMLA